MKKIGYGPSRFALIATLPSFLILTLPWFFDWLETVPGKEFPRMVSAMVAFALFTLSVFWALLPAPWNSYIETYKERSK